MKPKESKRNIFADCYLSFRSLPTWVQIWVMFILMPLNMLSIYFINEPSGALVAVLAISAMMLNMPVMLFDRGFSKMMAIPHIIPWTVLVVLIAFYRPDADGLYDTYLTVLLVVNIVSLIFDYPDTVSWLRGDRDVSR